MDTGNQSAGESDEEDRQLHFASRVLQMGSSSGWCLSHSRFPHFILVHHHERCPVHSNDAWFSAVQHDTAWLFALVIRGREILSLHTINFHRWALLSGNACGGSALKCP